MHGEAGKGDRFRPVDKKKFDRNFERIFGPRDKGRAMTKRPRVKPTKMWALRLPSGPICLAVKKKLAPDYQQVIALDYRDYLALKRAAHALAMSYQNRDGCGYCESDGSCGPPCPAGVVFSLVNSNRPSKAAKGKVRRGK